MAMPVSATYIAIQMNRFPLVLQQFRWLTTGYERKYMMSVEKRSVVFKQKCRIVYLAINEMATGTIFIR